MTQWTLAIWFLVPLPFLNPAWTSGSSQFMYCWSLAWRILSITTFWAYYIMGDADSQASLEIWWIRKFGVAFCMCFHKPDWWFWCPLTFGDHSSSLWAQAGACPFQHEGTWRRLNSLTLWIPWLPLFSAPGCQEWERCSVLMNYARGVAVMASQCLTQLEQRYLHRRQLFHSPKHPELSSVGITPCFLSEKV